MRGASVSAWSTATRSVGGLDREGVFAGWYHTPLGRIRGRGVGAVEGELVVQAGRPGLPLAQHQALAGAVGKPHRDLGRPRERVVQQRGPL
jgi:hypothetical protein